MGSFPLSRGNDLTLEWDATGYTAGEHVSAFLFAGSGWVACEAAATDGTITIPASLLASAAGNAGVDGLLSLGLKPARSPVALYSVPLVRGGSFPGVMNWSYYETIQVTWE